MTCFDLTCDAGATTRCRAGTGWLDQPSPRRQALEQAERKGHIRAMIRRLYRLVSNPRGWSGLPDYELREGRLYRAVSHPQGWSGLPDYEQRGNAFYRTVSHPLGWSGLPDYEVRGDGRLYRAVSHPDGWGGLADFEFR